MQVKIILSNPVQIISNGYCVSPLKYRLSLLKAALKGKQLVPSFSYSYELRDGSTEKHTVANMEQGKMSIKAIWKAFIALFNIDEDNISMENMF
jgi:hypothetical protein